MTGGHCIIRGTREGNIIMNDAKHTLGPWSFHLDGDANRYSILAHGNWLISFLHNGEQLSEKQLANARLIAAAPELFAACEVALRRLRDPAKGVVPVYDQLRTALAKAAGA